MGAVGARADLLDDASATGSDVQWGGGRGSFMAEGTFDGATVTLQVITPNGTWIPVSSATALTAAGAAEFELPAGRIRAAVSGGTPTALYAWAILTRK